MLNERNVQGCSSRPCWPPLFQTRWRLEHGPRAVRAAVPQRAQGAPRLQRFRADDLLTAVFPKLTGCQENVTAIWSSDHPLVEQTMHDCLFEAHDLRL